jgi:hypothetical protein
MSAIPASAQKSQESKRDEANKGQGEDQEVLNDPEPKAPLIPLIEQR